MYLFYALILCDISLILANTPDYYTYSSDLTSRSPERLDFKEWSGRARQKRSNEAPSEVVLQKQPDKNITNDISKLKTNAPPPINASIHVDASPNGDHSIPAGKGGNSPNEIYSLSPNTTSNGAVNGTGSRKTSINLNDTSVVPQYSLPQDVTNETLAQNNITSKSVDSHVYYNSSILYDPAIGQHYWVEFNNKSDTITHQMLSQSHRRAVTIPLPFKFQFYGHEIENVTIATGGFLFTGDYIHSWLAATQYIAPLMANFDTSLSNDSFIKYVSNSTTFTVLWENVSLQERPNDGNFTFEVTLYKSGDIIFVYKNLPNITYDITEDHHPVKVGLSDAYILERTLFFVRRKTIFEYHRVHFDKRNLRNWTVIHLTPLPTCQNKTSCESCLSKDISLLCQWCDNRCSTGVDRKRHDWVKKDCEKRKINETKYCSLINDKPVAGAHKTSYNEKSQTKSGSSKFVLFLVIAVASVFFVFVWILYAYRNPHSTSGQLLIRYRPSQWNSWRKGEARYTAATIHM